MAETGTKTAPAFKLAQLEESDKYEAVKDLLRVILDPDKTYTTKEVVALLKTALAHPVQEEINR